MSKNQIYKPSKVKGFPEWLPEERLIEQKWLDHIRRTFEAYGFTSIETPAVEELNVLLAKGETDKEIYTLTRLQADEDHTKEARLGLHFDQTVPFARYTAQHFNDLTFPFKRYQMQKVWRGERPQLGRMREFLQCDIDVINVDHLPLSFDAEIPAIIYEVLTGLDIGRVQIKINNRKILQGYYESKGITDSKIITLLTRSIDKIDKFNLESIWNILEIQLQDLGCEHSVIDHAIKCTVNYINKTKCFLDEHIGLAEIFGENDNALLKEGIEELAFVLDQLSHLPDNAVKADLSIVRGLDYYTGTVYETRLLDIPEFTSSVCSGGRYDDLAGSYINKHLPGVGISIGFTRLFDVLKHNGYIKPAAKCPTDVLVTLPSDDQRALSNDTARGLRQRGYNVEVYHAAQKPQKQLAYAEKKGIPYVWFPELGEVKTMATGEQMKADIETWKK